MTDTATINQPAFNTVLEGYEAQAIFDGAWILKTNLAPQAFYAQIHQALRGGQVVVVSVEKSAIQNAVWTDSLSNWVGITRAA